VRSARADQSQADSRQNRQPAPQQQIKRNIPDPADVRRTARSETAAKADKIEIKDFDIGRRAAEVVGTVDAVQRFDNNSDGRVDLLESQRATRSRDTSFTYAARGQARVDGPSVATQVQDQEIAKSVTEPVRHTAPQPNQPIAQTPLADGAANGAGKIFGDAQIVSGGSDGTFSDGVQVPQKFFGEGSEVIVGRFASDADVQQKFSDKVDQADAGRYYENGTGEQKLYDKVSQSEPGRFAPEQEESKYYGEGDLPVAATSGEEGQAEASLYEKAQQVEAQAGGRDQGAAQQKKLYAELELYSDVAAFGEEAAGPIPTVTDPVTA
jgi:hypothetical protein